MIRHLIFVTVFTLSGCASLGPVMQDFNVVSVQQEKELGDKLAQEVAKESAFVTDAASVNKVNSIGQRLVNALPRREFEYRFYVIENKSPNAFTIPGAHIYVHSGLLSFVDDDNQLAGILAHEIGHMYERHPAKGLSRQLGIQQLVGLVFPQNQARLRSIALAIAGGGVITKFSRQDEYEADEISYFLMKKAGYPTNGLTRFLIKLNQMYGAGFSIPFMSTHPPTPDRIQRLQILEKTGQVPTSALFSR